MFWFHVFGDLFKKASRNHETALNKARRQEMLLEYKIRYYGIEM